LVNQEVFVSSGSDLTILLTLKDRALFTVRWMNYADSIAFPFKVLIADGGSDESVPAMLSEKMRFPNVDFEYVRYPYDKSYAEYYAKIADALARIRTPFVAMADNDDFLIVDTLHEAVEFLSTNSDYASCGGQGSLFWIRATEAHGVVYGNRIDYKCGLIPSISAESAKERLRSQSLSSADPLFYDVKRIEDARKQFEIVRTLNLNDLFLCEILVQFLMAIAGKTKRLNRLYLARQHNSPDSSAGEHYNRFGDWFGRMLLETWSDDFTKFVSTVSSCLAAADGIQIDEAKECVVDAYRFLSAPHIADVSDEYTVTLRMFIVAAIADRLLRLPKQSIIRKLAWKLYRTVDWISFDALDGRELFVTPVSNLKKDLEPVLEFLKHPR
jgi:glycosyltransferase domain-containing protein